MEQITKFQFEEVLKKIALIEIEIESLRKIEKIPKITIIEESLAEIWDNDEDERWNKF